MVLQIGLHMSQDHGKLDASLRDIISFWQFKEFQSLNDTLMSQKHASRIHPSEFHVVFIRFTDAVNEVRILKHTFMLKWLKEVTSEIIKQLCIIIHTSFNYSQI